MPGGHGGLLESGELVLREEGGGRTLSTSLFSRWSRMRSGPPAPGAVKQITSLANPIVKDIRGLALPKNRKASGLFVAEGLKLVADAVEAGWTIRTLVHASSVANQPLVPRLAATCHAKGGSVIAVSEAVLAKISRRDNPQTVLGVFEQKLTPASAIKPRERRRLGGAGSGARPRQSRHDRAHGGRGRRRRA